MPFTDPAARRAASKRHYQKHRENVISAKTLATRKRRAERHAEVREYLLTHPCVDCGEEDPRVLEFDHRDPENKSHSVAKGFADCSRDRFWAEVAKCDVRCCNCHRRRTRIQFGWASRG